MRRTLLQQVPDVVSHPLQLLAQLPIPNPLHKNTLRAQELVTFAVLVLLVRKAVAKPIGFQHELRFGAVEIQIVLPQRMLPPELIAGKAAVSQQPPQRLLRPGSFPAKLTGTNNWLHGARA
jgi:hypothetical protein